MLFRSCGNVLHVHDLVDYVSEEAERAGENAAKFVSAGCRDMASGEDIQLIPADGVRYTVPSTINPGRMDKMVTVRFRVGAVYKNAAVSVYFNEERVMHNRKRIISPGEMEQVILLKSKMASCKDLKNITIKIEQD